MADEELRRYEDPTITESGFKYSCKEVKQRMFSLSDSAKTENGAEVISENNVSGAFLGELKLFIDSNRNTVFDNRESLTGLTFEVFIFVSKDASYLSQAYSITQPEPNEIGIFLEDNTGDLFSGSTSYIVVGKEFEYQRSTLASIDKNALSSFLNVGTYQLDFKTNELEELIKYGRIVTTDGTVAGILTAALLEFAKVSSQIFNAIGDGIFELTGLIRSYITFQDYHWDPEALITVQSPEGNSEVPNSNFTPVLLPGSYDLIEAGNSIMDYGVDKISDQAVSVFSQRAEQIKSFKIEYIDNTIRKYLGESFDFVFVPIDSMFDSLFRKVDELIVAYKNLCMENSKAFGEVFTMTGRKMLNCVNAYFCGIWNSFIECIIGWVDLVGLLFKIAAAPGELYRWSKLDVPEYQDEMLQALRKIRESLSNLDVDLILSSLFQQLTAINIESLTSSGTTTAGAVGGSIVDAISLERVCYFIGAVIGFLVEMLLEILLTAGVAGVVSTIEKVGQTLVKFGSLGLRFMEKAPLVLAKFFKKSLTEIMSDVFGLLSKLVELFKKGTAEVILRIQNFFELLIDVTAMTAEMIAEAIRYFKLSKSEVKVLSDCGYEFVQFEKGVAVLTKICK